MAISKAGINSQSGNRLDELEPTVANLTQALAALQEQVDNLGGGMYRVVSIANETIASGVTGTIWQTPSISANQIINLYILASATTVSQPGISLIVDGSTVASGTLAAVNASSTSPSNYTVTRNFYSTNASSNTGRMNEIKGKVMSLVKDAGDTTRSITIAYEILEPIE